MEYHLTEKSGGCPVCINERKKEIVELVII